MISVLKARKILSKGCTSFLAHVVSKVELSLSNEEMPIIQEFLDMFPIKLPRLALKREIEFNIELVLGTTPTSKLAYRMALVEL